MVPEEVELSESELQDVAGGAYDERTGECHCNGCGTLMDFKGVDRRKIKEFVCPKCGRKAHVYY